MAPAPTRRLMLRRVEGSFAVCRLPADASIPVWTTGSSLCSITRTADEFSVVCPESAVPAEVRCERGWIGVRITGAIPFSETGVLAALVTPLAEVGVGLFAISTFDTDYLLVKADDEKRARAAWLAAGHRFEDGP